mmetsp:Transcript_37858/g.87519  ORF Transcript_37858/g.87519 Transcript_37858/m.87519 type:complete len:257 (-) Transcript_37858:1348-2118(-)
MGKKLRPDVFKPSSQDAREDAIHGHLRECWLPHKIEVSEQPWGDWHAAATRWPTSGNELHILHILPKQLLVVIEAAVVNDLSKQLNGRLRAILLEHWHVDVVHKEYHGGAWRCSQQVLALPLHLVLQHVDHVVCARLCTEVGGGAHILLSSRLQELLNTHRLPNTCLASAQSVEPCSKQVFQQPPLSSGLSGGNENVEEWLAHLVRELRHDTLQCDKGAVLIIDCIVVQIIVRQGRAKLQQVWAQELRELGSRVLM